MFYKVDGDKLLFNDTGELIYYVPEKYFDINVAVLNGKYVDLLGIFLYGLYDKNGKQLQLKLFNLPTFFRCSPYQIDKVSKMHLQGTKEEQAYRLLRFKQGDELITNMSIPQSVDNVDKFANLLIRSNLPEAIPYDKIHELIISNAKINGFDYKVSPQIMGLIISELCRDSNNLDRPFRYSDMKDMTAYTSISIVKVPKYTSAYTSITSENADEAVASAMTVKASAESSLEKIMMETADGSIEMIDAPYLEDIFFENGNAYVLEPEENDSFN